MQISVTVKPGSSKGPLVVQEAGDLTLFVREKALDGAANSAVIQLVAKHFGVPKTACTIVRGQASNHKIIRIVHDK